MSHLLIFAISIALLSSFLSPFGIQWKVKILHLFKSTVHSTIAQFWDIFLKWYGFSFIVSRSVDNNIYKSDRNVNSSRPQCSTKCASYCPVLGDCLTEPRMMAASGLRRFCCLVWNVLLLKGCWCRKTEWKVVDGPLKQNSGSATSN